MVHYQTIMIDGVCAECGAKEIDNLSCHELFNFPLAWEHNDPNLYALHFWLVSCYMIQHPSSFTEEGYLGLLNLFTEAYDHSWDTPYILRKNRDLVKTIKKIKTSLPSEERQRIKRNFSITIEDIYSGGEKNAIQNVLLWKKEVRSAIDYLNLKERQ
ncbi:DUF5946 family protein [Vagococcus carniphilus]|uniref:DUF5946 family protein n=1 Tax=Vagococcus carniphilus TaxID=218144 RepID=UPI003BACEC39